MTEERNLINVLDYENSSSRGGVSERINKFNEHKHLSEFKTPQDL